MSNTSPNFTAASNIGSVPVTAANAASDGSGTIGTNIFKALTAGANGSFVDRVEFMPTATAANTATTATVARVFLSTQSAGATTSANTYLLGEIALASVTAASSTGASLAYSFPLGYRIPANSTILVTNHAAPAANTAWRANTIAGDY